jgi:thiol-disulfide isomerase/thioredoxin
MVFIHINKNNYTNYSETSRNPIELLNHFLHKKNVFVLIYMEGCGPCNAVRPEWKKLENILKDYKYRHDVAIVDIDKNLLEKVKYVKHHPNSFPTMRYITNRGESIENYEDSNIKNKDRSVDSFVEWVKSKESNKSHIKNKTKKHGHKGGKTMKKKGGKWSLKYKRSINCRNPKGFSQKQYCKYSRNK